MVLKRRPRDQEVKSSTPDLLFHFRAASLGKLFTHAAGQ